MINADKRCTQQLVVQEKRKADAELNDELSSVGLSPMALHVRP